MPRIRVIAVWLVCLAAGLAAAADGDVGATIYRDTWGVPHIYADSARAAIYAHGYAQAEDRLRDVLETYLSVQGRAAAVFGESRVEHDYAARLARHAELSREKYAELAPRTRGIVEAFVDGIAAYMREHPDEVPAWAEPPQPHLAVAVYRAMLWNWPWGQARGDLRAARSESAGDRGSNQWVVAAARSAEGAPIALIDPHLSWDPVNLFYEAHVHGGDLDFFGFSIVGTPIMALGHTDVFSLALTTGGPDCADVYEERIHPDDPLRYEYDGEWRPVEVERLAIEVKTADGKRVETRSVERTHHGPIVKREGQRAFAVKTAYDDQIGLVEQWLQIALARDLGGFLNAMRLNQAPPQNVMYADVHKNTYYVRAGRVPVRPAGFDWNRPVPGWTSDSEWRGVHRLSELVQLLNPPNGYMQNCNNSPDVMMPESPLTPDRYRDYIYNIRPRRENSRGRRMLELLAAHDKLTVEHARQMAVDTHVDRADRWQRALSEAFTAHGADHPELRAAVTLISEWNRRLDVDSRAGALFRFWMAATREDGSGVPRSRVSDGEALEADEQRALLQALGEAAELMRSRIGRIDVAWGEIHRLERGGRSWPVSGCRANGISTLRSVRWRSPDAEGRSRAYGGQLCTTVVLLAEDGVVSYSMTPFGQSADPRSAHYADQAERLFSRGELKPTWYGRSELEPHVRSKRSLTFRAPAPAQ